MEAVVKSPSIASTVVGRALQLFQEHQLSIFRRTDRLFARLMLCQWVVAMAVAVWVTPLAWAGRYSHLHLHLYAAVFFGGAITLFPCTLAVVYPGRASTRYVIGASQMLMSALLIDLTGGRIETHFHVFGSLAILAFYRDWRVFLPATAVLAADHFLRGIYWPLSVFGLLTASPWRWVEHAGWVIFEDVFLFRSCFLSVREMMNIAHQRAELEHTKEIVEGKVLERTRDLQASEARKSAILGSSLDCIISIDAEGRITEFNPAAEKVFGYLRSEVLGRMAEETIIPPAYRGGMAHLMDTGEGLLLERRIETSGMRADGSEFPCELAVSRVDCQGTVMFTAFLRDLTDRKRTEEHLRILSSAVEQSPLNILIAGLDGKIEYVNAKLIQSTGYSFEELKGKPPAILAGRDMSQEHFAEIEETIKTGEWNGVLQTRRKNGEVFSESVKILRIHDSSGAPTHTLALAEDITERLEMEAALLLSQERFRIAAESSGDSIYEWDLQTDAITFFGGNQQHFVNSCRKLPHTGDEFLELIHPGDRQGVKSALLRGIRTGERFSEEFRVLGVNGEVYYWAARGAALRDKEGHPYLWIGVCKDLTEEKKVERANADLAAIVESADAAIIRKDLEDRVITWNRGAERIYGYTAEESIGRTMAVVIPSDRVTEDRAIKERVRRGESVNHIETVRLTKSGDQIHVLLTISPIRDRDGIVTGIAVVAWDITQIKQLESRLAQAQKLESIGQLAAGVAHEINTPIQYIGDNGKFLQDAFRDLVKFAGRQPEDATEEPLDEGVFEYLRDEVPRAIEQLLEGVDHVARIVRAMKEFSHPGPLEKMPLDINRAIESTILVSKNEWKYVADVTTEFEGDLPLVPCLAGELNQVILNVIVNAAHAIAEFNKDSGRKGAIHISTHKSPGGVEIRVRDTGGGIPKAIQSKVFDPFFTTKPVGKGTGQGLAIAHSVIVQKHNGTIQFESEVGTGTTFVIQLPLACELEPA
ncbi:MAG: hypothetical protein C5B51_24240 [Terriglobia bacterium]|nr:MAG: hypothetical protein C5B51_24240 [Terriglobia bacterium]